MSTGVSGFFDLSGTNGISARIGYEETYDVSTNKSTVAISYIYIKSSSYYGVTYYLNGSISIAGSTAMTMSSSSNTHRGYISTLGYWADVTGSMGSVSGITHNDDGTKTVAISVSLRGYTSSGGAGSGWSVSGSKTVTLTTIPRSSSLSASNGTLGTAQTLSISRHSDTFYHSIRYDCGDVSTAICTKVSDTDISFVPPLALAKQNTAGTSVSITFTLYTFESDADDAAEIGRTTKTITCAIPASVKPECSITVNDALGHVAKYGGYIQGQSVVEVLVTPTLAYEAPITEYKVTADGNTYTNSDVEISPIKGSGSIDISATVTDSRGRSGSVSESITVIPYSAPSITQLTVHRCNADGIEDQLGEYAKVRYSYVSTSLSEENMVEVWLKYKATSDDEYGDLIDIMDAYSVKEGIYIFPAATDSSYDVVITINDDFSETERSTSISTGECYMDWDYDNNAIAFGKIAEKNDAFECGLTMYDKFGALIGNGLAAYGSASSPIDPDTTIEPLALTNSANCPVANAFYYIHTVFYSTKSATANRAQIAMPYKTNGSIYRRHYVSGAWSAWDRYMTADEIYPVGSVCIRYDTTSPATLYGGTWQRIEGRMLFGCAESGTVGATGTHTTGSGSSSLPYVNVAIWRRTA